ncbi:MAG TPA: MerR family transcriptional regulator [Egibacteraceae bacterium]|jgi:DNA-binding transcriptional MerR regulator|nr:MerR family transcriptional regulator [Egibacteraceae bacterium]
MRYRVDDLATRCGVSVDTVRYYQGLGLLDPPVREGRAAWYDDGHAARLEQIRELKAKGFPLSTIRRVLSGELDGGDEALAAALADPLPDEAETALLTPDEVAGRTGVSPALLQVMEREGLLLPRRVDGEPRYTVGDAEAVSAGLELLDAGVPLGELLDLARRYDEAMRGIADDAVELFARFVRDPIQGSAASEQEASERLVTAFRRMLPATSAVVAHHFRRLLIERARARFVAEGDAAEVAVARSETARLEGG